MENIITRKTARALGLTSYYTGEPCKNGHTSYRYVQSGTCAQCIRASNGNPNAASNIAAANLARIKLEQVAQINAIKLELIQAKVRLFESDVVSFSNVALELVTARYPTVTLLDVDAGVVFRDKLSQTRMQAYNIHPDDLSILKEMSESLIRLHSNKSQIQETKRNVLGGLL